jgi:hypothetical protein
MAVATVADAVQAAAEVATESAERLCWTYSAKHLGESRNCPNPGHPSGTWLPRVILGQLRLPATQAEAEEVLA